MSTTALRGILADLSHGMTGYFLEAFEQQNADKCIEKDKYKKKRDNIQTDHK